MEGTPALKGPEGFVRSVVSALAQVTAEGLTEAERIEVVSALESLKGGASAAQARITASAVTDREALGEDSRSVRADLALARRCSPTLADQHAGVARALVDEMPKTMAALTRGEISERWAAIVDRETACLSREHRSEVDRRLAPGISRRWATRLWPPPRGGRVLRSTPSHSRSATGVRSPADVSVSARPRTAWHGSRSSVR
ncbi:DUF222 domain-containing protein [Knoellia locipacati]|uniref:hypothetical protein n=1 Tax=Knoellia locipacati TaxID=882824 RepID=UPI00384CC608